MRVLMINSVCGIRSTGRICTELADEYMLHGHEVRIAYGRETVPEKYQPIAVQIGTSKDVYISALKARIFDNEGFNSKRATKEFLKWAEEYNPDLLWLHNLHGYYINVKMLFDWIKSRPNMQVKWTLHDCWAFTGHCSHFKVAKCDKWKTECRQCVQKKRYPKSSCLDNSAKNYKNKKTAFTGVAKLTVITPSRWLADLVKQSYLREYPIEVVYNSINTNIFKPTDSDFRKRYNLENKKIVLGVATAWGESKGLYDFIELSQKLSDEYKVVLVGTTPTVEKKLPKTILAIRRTNSASELAEIYTAADVFVNPSKEETFGLTTLEAISCGTKAIVYRDTACEEVVQVFGGGIAVEPSRKALFKTITETVLNNAGRIL